MFTTSFHPPLWRARREIHIRYAHPISLDCYQLYIVIVANAFSRSPNQDAVRYSCYVQLVAIEAKLDARSEFRSLARGGWKLVVNIAVSILACRSICTLGNFLAFTHTEIKCCPLTIHPPQSTTMRTTRSGKVLKSGNSVQA